MSEITATADGRVKRELGFVYPCYKDMVDNNIIFSFRGKVTADLVTNVLEMMGEKLEDENETKKMSKKLSNVMVECLTNVYAEETTPIEKPHYDPTALLLVKKVLDAYVVITGSFIATNTVSKLKKVLDHINSLDKDGLKDFYVEQLSSETRHAHNGLTVLGMVDLARKSKHQLTYQFKLEDAAYTYFLLEARISPQSF